jgi:NAD-dependent SIR2 family protein deacetylase
MEGCMRDVWDAGEFAPVVDTAKCRLINAAPVCPYCGGMARPNIVMFGDWNWLDTRHIPQRKRQDQWFDSVIHGLGSVVVQALDGVFKFLIDFGPNQVPKLALDVFLDFPEVCLGTAEDDGMAGHSSASISAKKSSAD